MSLLGSAGEQPSASWQILDEPPSRLAPSADWGVLSFQANWDKLAPPLGAGGLVSSGKPV